MPAVPDFVPSKQGFGFPNQFPPGTKAVPWLPRSIFGLRFNDASDGLCGGMVFAAVDYFETKTERPKEAEAPTPPPPESPLFSFLVRRIIASWHILSGGFLRYAFWMNPLVPDRWRARSSAREAAHVLELIGQGHPLPLGLVRIKSWNPSNLRYHHQVVAWEAEPAGAGLIVRVYDPNHPVGSTDGDPDDMRLTLSSTDPNGPITLTYSDGGEPVFCFFRIRYSPRTPPSGD